MGFFCPQLKIHEFKIYWELRVMRMKNGAKIEEELTSQFKTDMINFDSSTQKSQKFAL